MSRDLPFDLPFDVSEIGREVPMSSRGSWAVIYADASMSNDGVGIAYWVLHKDGYFHGVETSKARGDSFFQEARATMRGVEKAVEEIEDLIGIHLRVDHAGVIRTTESGKEAKVRSDMTWFRSYVNKIKARYVLVAEHVKGHERGDTVSSWLNNWCDAAARAAMRHGLPPTSCEDEVLRREDLVSFLSEREARFLRHVGDLRVARMVVSGKQNKCSEEIIAKLNSFDDDLRAAARRLLDNESAWKKMSIWERDVVTKASSEKGVSNEMRAAVLRIDKEISSGVRKEPGEAPLSFRMKDTKASRRDEGEVLGPRLLQVARRAAENRLAEIRAAAQGRISRAGESSDPVDPSYNRDLERQKDA